MMIEPRFAVGAPLGYVPIWSDSARGSISSLAQLVLVAEWGMKIRLQSDSHIGNYGCFW